MEVGFIFYDLAEIGFFSAAIVYLFTFFFLFYTQRNTLQRYLLAVTIVAIMLCAFSAGVILHIKANPVYFMGFETVRNCLCLALIFSRVQVSSSDKLALLRRKWAILFIALLIPCLEYTLFYSGVSLQVFLYFHLIQSIVLLVMLEQLFDKTVTAQKVQIKPLCIGLGIIVTYDFAFYADSILTRSIDSLLFIAKTLALLFASPFIVRAIKRMQHASMRISPSREIVLNSTLLILSGIYLLSMSLIGYFINYLNMDWSNVIQTIFVAFSFILFSFLLYSEVLRFKLNKFIIKHFYADKYDYNKELANFSHILAEQDDPYQVALKALMHPFGCQQGALFCLEHGELSLKSHCLVTKILLGWRKWRLKRIGSSICDC